MLILLFTYLFIEIKSLYSLKGTIAPLTVVHIHNTHHPNQDTECFCHITPESSLMPPSCHPLFHPEVTSLLISITKPIMAFHISGIMQYVLIGAWLLSNSA